MNVPWRREARESLAASHRLLVQTRKDRQGGWFPLLLFGFATLAAMPLYEVQMACGERGVVCAGTQHVRILNAFSSVYSLQSQGRWLSAYWVLAMVSVYGLTVLYYRRRGNRTGLRGRTWPTVGTGGILLAVILMAAGWLSGWPVALGNYGTEPLAIVAISLFVLARTERSLPMAIFAGGFLGLTSISLFYNVVNAFERVGIAGPFAGSGTLLPNLIVPGTYLLLGGLLFCNSTRRTSVFEGDLHD